MREHSICLYGEILKIILFTPYLSTGYDQEGTERGICWMGKRLGCFFIDNILWLEITTV